MPRILFAKFFTRTSLLLGSLLLGLSVILLYNRITSFDYVPPYIFTTSENIIDPQGEFLSYIIRKPVCESQKRVAYIKVHKATSTTMTSIIQRFGLINNLKFAIPSQGIFHLGLFGTFHPKNALPLLPGEVYEILCQHVVYKREAFKKYLPPDIKVISTVRHPFQRFVSAFLFFPEYKHAVKSHWFSLESSVHLMRKFLNDPEKYEPEGFKPGSLVYNRMSFDLGVPKEQYNNMSFVESYIKQLDADMELVLVHEYFDESLVLLKRRMCWSIKDILYVIHHAGPSKPVIPEDLKQLHKMKAPSEYQIYNFFRSKILRLLEAEPDVAEEVKFFRETQRVVDIFCRGWKGTLIVQATKYDNGFIFTQNDCHLLTMDERTYVKLLRKLQSGTP